MSKLKECEFDTAFFYYVTDCLFYEGKGMRVTKRFCEVANPKPIIEENGDEIAKDVITRMGLEVTT